MIKFMILNNKKEEQFNITSESDITIIELLEPESYVVINCQYGAFISFANKEYKFEHDGKDYVNDQYGVSMGIPFENMKYIKIKRENPEPSLFQVRLKFFHEPKPIKFYERLEKYLNEHEELSAEKHPLLWTALAIIKSIEK